MVSLNGKRRITLENIPKVKNLQTYIEEYIANNGQIIDDRYHKKSGDSMRKKY